MDSKPLIQLKNKNKNRIISHAYLKKERVATGNWDITDNPYPQYRQPVPALTVQSC